MTISPELVYFEHGGVRLVGERWEGERWEGEAPGGLVLLLHGGGQTRHSWQRTAARLAREGTTTLALDARGHGDSDWDAGEDYSLDAFVGDLVSVIDTLDDAPVLVGASLGGTTALVAAGEHPGLARGLVLVDIVVRPEVAGVARITEFMTAHHDGFESLEEVADAIAAYNPVRKRSRNLDGLRKNVRQHADGRWHWHWDPAFMRVDDEPQRRFDPARLEAAAARLTIPVMIVRGARSEVVSDAAMQDMLRMIPHATHVDVSDAGHMVAGDDNDVFTASLGAFLAAIEADQR
jgi:pimeloyl-ACP methyl ester carboxylesterase